MNLIGRYLSRNDVLLGLDVADKTQALARIAALLETRHGVHAGPVLRALSRREDIGSTGIGHGVALPHARLPGLREPIVMAVTTRYPIAFGAIDRKPVALLFVILVPERANDEHLAILATVAAMLAEPEFRRRALALTDTEEARRLFCEWGEADRDAA